MHPRAVNKLDQFLHFERAEAHCDIPCGIYDRYIAVKEEHAELCKREVLVIWGDYFKAEHFEKHPELPALVHKIM